MAVPIAIIHGWSDTSESFWNLRDYLVAHGHQTTELWLGDYISMDDDVRVEDVAKRMNQVIAETIAAGDLTAPFDMIVHSTGGLVAREWLMTFHPDGRNCPVRRIVMLAPANFGSALAATGKSFVGRVLKGWDNWFHTGQQMLNDLELASPYQWDLARRDLLDPDDDAAGGPYGPDKVWPFVIVGSSGYSDGLRKIVNEFGADGTVRVPAANLNAIGMTIDFTGTADAAPVIGLWRNRSGFGRMPFAVLPGRNHGSIIRPELACDDGEDRLGELILTALACASADEYRRIATDWDEISAQTAALAADSTARTARFGRTSPKPESFHQYLQAIVRVIDDHGRPVRDFFLEFFDPDRHGHAGDDDADAVFLHREVIENVHPNALDPSYRCLYIDRTDLVAQFYKRFGNKVAMSISAAPIGENIHFFGSDERGAQGHIDIHSEDVETREHLDGRLHRNTTHLIEIRIPRQPIDKVFRFTR